MLTPTLISLYVTWVLLIVLAYSVFVLYRHFGQLYVNSPAGRAEQGPEVGSALLSATGLDTLGRSVVLPTSQRTILLFADVTCDLCAGIRDSSSVLTDFADRLSVIVACGGSQQDVSAWAGRAPDFMQVICDEKLAIAGRYKVDTLPYAIAVDASGIVKAKSIVNGSEGLLWAVHQALDIGLVSENHSSEVTGT